VGQHRPLRRTGGAGGIEQRHRRLGESRRGDAVGRLTERFRHERVDLAYPGVWRKVHGQLGGSDHGRRIGVTQNVRQLARTKERVDGDNDQPELRRSEPEVDDFDAIAEEEGNAVTGPKPASLQQMGQLVAPAFEVPIRERHWRSTHAFAFEGRPRGTAD
jgi:hypothetical protein